MTAPKTTAKRPSVARRSTRSSEALEDKELDRGIAFTDDDGIRIQVRIRDVTGVHDAALVSNCGLDFMGLMEAASVRQGLDVMAALVWFARLVNGRTEKTYAETLEEMTYTSIITRDFDEPSEGDDPPEA